MKCDKIESIMEQLRELHDVMLRVLPKENINQHPFDFFEKDMDSITEIICECTQKFQDTLNKKKECSKLLLNEYKKIVIALNAEETVIPSFKNIHMEIEFMLNELERIVAKRRQLENTIIRKSEDIYEIFGELGLLEKDAEDGMFNAINTEQLNIDCINLSKRMFVIKEGFVMYGEMFNKADLHGQYKQIKELLAEKHFCPEKKLCSDRKQMGFTSPSKNINEELSQLYRTLKNTGEVDFYSYVYSLIVDHEISYEKLTKLETSFTILHLEKSEKEKSRRIIFKNTSNLLKRLGIIDRELFIDQKLFRLVELENKYSRMVEEREKEVVELLNDIRNKEEILSLNIKDFKEGYKRTGNKNSNTSILSTTPINDSFLTLENDSIVNRCEDLSQEMSAIQDENNYSSDVNGSITTSNIEYLRKYARQLSEECNKRINEIYNNTKEYLEELCKLFTLKIGEYEVSTNGINLMRKEIEGLEPKKELYLEISSLIDKRAELIESMNEFEKIASDPRRLFKSSFQLLREEKFRKSAFPSLLKIEESLFQLLEKYKMKFGDFKKNNISFGNTLKEEIEGRIINKTVFINKFDSPIRRKKN